MQAQQGGAPAQQTGTGGDALDKGVDSILKKAGKGQSASTTEKISDVIRKGFKKLTDVPIQDKPMA